MELKDLKELLRFFDKSGLMEMEYETEGDRIYFSKNGIAPSVNSSPVIYSNPPKETPSYLQEKKETLLVENKPKAGDLVKSPIIGTYYAAPSPGATPFVSVGDTVEKGQTLCIIEAMKIMNTIEAEFRCKILEIYPENGKPVEYGQDLFRVEPF